MERTNFENCEYCNRRSPIFSFLTNEELSYLNKGRYEVVYDKGETIFKKGTPIIFMASFTYGMAIICPDHHKSSLILKFVKPVDFLGVEGIVKGKVYPYSVIAIKKSALCFIDIKRFRKVMDVNKVFNTAFIRELVEANSFLLNRLSRLSFLQSPGKVADALLYLSEDVYGSDSFTFEMPIKDIARIAGISKESTFNMIRDFTTEGIISVSKKVIVIKNSDRLKEIAKTG